MHNLLVSLPVFNPDMTHGFSSALLMSLRIGIIKHFRLYIIFEENIVFYFLRNVPLPPLFSLKIVYQNAFFHNCTFASYVCIRFFTHLCWNQKKTNPHLVVLYFDIFRHYCYHIPQLHGLSINHWKKGTTLGKSFSHFCYCPVVDFRRSTWRRFT